MAGLPSTIKQQQKDAADRQDSKGLSFSIPLLNRVPKKKIVDFTRGLAVMISARIGLVKAFDIAISQEKEENFKQILSIIRKDLKKGKSLSESMQKHSECFDDLYTHLVEVGEAAGLLNEILLRLADYKEKAYQLRQKVRAALIYPAIIIFVAIAAVSFLLTVVVPTFVDMYRDFEAELPGPTKFILAVSDFLTGNMLLILLSLVIAFFLLRWIIRKTKIRMVLEKFYIKFPVIGPLYQKSLITRFTKTLATLLQSGITLTDSLEILKQSGGSLLLNKEVHDLLSAVKKGKSITKTLSGSLIFPEMVIQMITVGEETASLDTMLHQVADHYESEVDILVDGLTSTIEPILIVTIGILLGGIIVALYLPIFELVNVVG